jgi:hypothetical protein
MAIAAAILTALILLPMGHALFWRNGGGFEAEIARDIEAIMAMDPEEASRAAIAQADYRLYSAGGTTDAFVPSIGTWDRDYARRFGYRRCILFAVDELSRQQAAANRLAIRQMEAYNRIVMSAVDKQFPGWGS